MKRKIGILILSLCVAKTVLAYNPNKASSPDFGSATVFNSDFNIQPGTGSTNGSDSARARIFFGTQSCTGSGTEGVIRRGTLTGLPYIDYTYRNGSSTIDFNGFTYFKVGGVAVASGILTDYIPTTNGTCTGLTGTNTTLNGTTSIPSAGVFSVNGRVLSDIEVSYLDGLSDFLTTLLAAKQADLGGIYCATMSDDTGTSTGAIRLGKSGDLTLTKVGNQFVYGLVGSASSKPSTMENGGTVTASPAFLDFDGDQFDPIGSSTGTRIALSTAQAGSTTPTANTVLKAGSTGTITMNWISDAYCYVYNTVGSPTVTSGTWTNVAMDADIGEARNATHTASSNSQIKILVPGMYEMQAKILTTGDASTVGLRICKNTQSEIPGSFAINYGNEGNGLQSTAMTTGIVHARLLANDYIYTQVCANANIELDYNLSTPVLPSPGTSSYATMSIRKIGE